MGLQERTLPEGRVFPKMLECDLKIFSACLLHFSLFHCKLGFFDPLTNKFFASNLRSGYFALHLDDGVPSFHEFRLRLQRCASLTEQLSTVLYAAPMEGILSANNR